MMKYIVGEYYNVLCLIETNYKEDIIWFDGRLCDLDDEQLAWMDLGDVCFRKEYIKIETFTPLIDHPHSDKENGQYEIHYHSDTRFENIGSSLNFRVQLPLKPNQKLEYRKVKYITNNLSHGITPPNFIKNSKLKHKCIHKGKCPHRGFDLSNIQAKDGIITCPLHGLEFDSKTKKLITNLQKI